MMGGVYFLACPSLSCCLPVCALHRHWSKFNKNDGSIFKTDSGAVDDMAQALSHYTYEKTRRRYLMLDVQGFKSMEGGKAVYTLTDPYMQSSPKRVEERTGMGDLRDKSIQQFFQEHDCSDVCRRLGLTSRKPSPPPPS